MTRRTAVTAAVPLLLAGLLAVPASGVGAPASSSDDLAARGLALAERGATVLLADAGGTRRLDRDVRAALARPGTDAAGRQVLLLSHEPESEIAPVGATTFGVPAGDLDGDGLDDVVTYSFGPEEGGRVQARRGTDGTVLWERPVEAEAGFVYPLGQDVTGDGRADLLLDELSLQGESVGTPVTSESRSRLRQVYGVVSGADGAGLWSRTVDGTVVERSTGVGAGGGGPVTAEAGAGTVEVEATGLPLLLLAGGGSPALVENVVDVTVRYRDAYAATPEAGGFAYDEVVRTSTSASAVDPATGTARALRSAAGVPGLALLEPVGDLDGDRSPEGVWVVDRGPDAQVACAYALDAGTCRGTDDDSTPPTTTELLGLADGAARWEREDAGYALVGVGAEADGDGTGDLVRQQPFGGLEVVSGRDGTPVWLTAADEDRAVVAVDGGVVALLGLLFEGPDGAELVLERRSLATGDVVDADRRPLPLGGSGFVLVYAQQIADGDGDGGAELVVGALTEASSEDPEEAPQVRSSARVVPVAAGPALLTTEGDDPRFLLGYPDLDGDGLAEVVLDVVTAVDDDAFGTDATALRVADGAALWRFRGSFLGFPYAAGDQDGRPGAELLAGRLRGDDVVAVSLRGADLGLRWTAG